MIYHINGTRDVWRFGKFKDILFPVQRAAKIMMASRLVQISYFNIKKQRYEIFLKKRKTKIPHTYLKDLKGNKLFSKIALKQLFAILSISNERVYWYISIPLPSIKETERKI